MTMEKGRMFRDSQIIVLGVCIAAATIISSVILSYKARQVFTCMC